MKRCTQKKSGKVNQKNEYKRKRDSKTKEDQTRKELGAKAVHARKKRKGRKTKWRDVFAHKLVTTTESQGG